MRIPDRKNQSISSAPVLYRVVLVSTDPGGTEYLWTEGLYEKPGAAKARKTFWENRHRESDRSVTAEIQSCSPEWQPWTG